MNRKFIYLSAFVLNAFAINANAADGTITFVGAVQEKSCTVKNDEKNQTVTMGTVSTKAFNAAGSLAAPTAFQISLIDCPANVTSNGRVSIRFDGDIDPSDTSDSKLLANGVEVNAGGAENVAIGIWNSKGRQRLANVLGRGVDSTPVAIDYSANAAAGTAKLSFISRYVSTAAAVTPGTIRTVSEFTVIYN